MTQCYSLSSLFPFPKSLTHRHTRANEYNCTYYGLILPNKYPTLQEVLEVERDRFFNNLEMRFIIFKHFSNIEFICKSHDAFL